MSKLAFKSDLLFADSARLPAIKSWLLETVWTRARYQEFEPEQFLRNGEEAVYGLEELIATGAQEIWGELAAESLAAPAIKSWLGLDAPLPLTPRRAAVVFDGLSLRELPLLLKLAADSGFRVNFAVGCALVRKAPARANFTTTAASRSWKFWSHGLNSNPGDDGMDG